MQNIDWNNLKSEDKYYDPNYQELTPDEQRKKHFEMCTRVSRLTGTIEQYDLSKFEKRPGVSDALTATKQFLTKPQHHFLTFTGAPGTGKTHLTKAIGWQYVKDLKQVRYWQCQDLLDELKKGFSIFIGDTKTMFDQLMNSVMVVPLLILDDLGAEKSTAWSEGELRKIIDYRYDRKLLTVVTTNASLSQLDERINDRLGEGEVITMKCSSYRIELARRRHNV